MKKSTNQKEKKLYQFRRWVFTWNANDHDELPNPDNLKLFLQKHTSIRLGVFQLEVGEEKHRRHFQGRLECNSRQTKKSLLNIFSNFYETSNLTFDPEESYDSSSYANKSQTRLSGPFWFGPDSYLIQNEAPPELKLYDWQKQLLKLVLHNSQNVINYLRERHVIVIYDKPGFSGKSGLFRNLKLTKNDVNICKLPLDRADRLRSAVCTVCNRSTPDIMFLDMPRTFGKDTDQQSFFEALEDIKNGWVVDTMYGKYREVIFTPTLFLILTNEDPNKFFKFMSHDRWLIFEISGKARQNRYLQPMSIYYPPHNKEGLVLRTARKTNCFEYLTFEEKLGNIEKLSSQI